MNNLYEWAVRWGVPAQALQDLLSMPLPTTRQSVDTEAAVQQEIRLLAPKIGGDMWRNNNGAAKTADGRQLRFGLGNDSKRINESFKSSDLIGITPVIVGPQHIGRMFGVFTAVEVKAGGWYWTGTKREQAQWNFLQLIKAKGGFATFARSTKDYQLCLNAHG